MPHFIWRLISQHLWISGVLFICLPAAGRDPFAAPQVVCQQPAASLENWRLLGIIGRPADYVGWLRSPQGKILRVARNYPLPFAEWQIEELVAFRLTLRAPLGCVPQLATLQIKGKYHEDRDSAAVAVERHRTGQG
jgi:pilus assembly protein HofP